MRPATTASSATGGLDKRRRALARGVLDVGAEMHGARRRAFLI
jgi:hypothetical protein